MKNIGFLILICLFSSCQSQTEQSSLSPSMQPNQSEADESSNNGSIEVERKIIKTAEIRFQVNDVNTSSEKIKIIAEKFSGSISNMSQVNNSYEKNNNITVRVPTEELDNFLKEVEKESIFTNSKQINSQDVTEEFLDITTRLNTKKEVRDRYIEILRNKAKTVEDILNAEDKIRIIQEEIESIEGRLKYINNRAAMSTIHINIYQEVEYKSSPKTYTKSFFTKIKEGGSNGWNLILNLIVGLVNIWPLILILITLVYFRRRIFNFRKK